MSENKTYETFCHSEDPRVALVSCREDFIDAAQSKRFQAVIWQKAVSEETIFSITNILERVWNVVKIGAIPLTNDSFLFDSMNFHLIEELPPYKDLISVKDDMTQAYRAITSSCNSIHYFFGKKLSEPEHTDNSNVINVSFGGLGTAWKNANGKILYAGAGNFLFFSREFKHFSPSMAGFYGETNSPSITSAPDAPVFLMSGGSL